MRPEVCNERTVSLSNECLVLVDHSDAKLVRCYNTPRVHAITRLECLVLVDHSDAKLVRCYNTPRVHATTWASGDKARSVT